jgi:hypothetical protein
MATGISSLTASTRAGDAAPGHASTGHKNSKRYTQLQTGIEKMFDMWQQVGIASTCLCYFHLLAEFTPKGLLRWVAAHW